MFKTLVPALAVILFFTSCSSLKPLNFTSNKQVISTADNADVEPNTKQKHSVKFINDIAVTPQGTNAPTESNSLASTKKESARAKGSATEPTFTSAGIYGDRSGAIEKANPLQLKYSIILDTEVEQLQNISLLKNIDEWYGTRYRLGGKTKSGIDCSAFVQVIFAAAYSMTLPRTAREQHNASRRISRTELKEGDLLFFNTTGGVSHVGIYLQNNKFVHASTSGGVIISDIFDEYWVRKFVGVGRLKDRESVVSTK